MCISQLRNHCPCQPVRARAPPMPLTLPCKPQALLWCSALHVPRLQCGCACAPSCSPPVLASVSCANVMGASRSAPIMPPMRWTDCKGIGGRQGHKVWHRAGRTQAAAHRWSHPAGGQQAGTTAEPEQEPKQTGGEPRRRAEHTLSASSSSEARRRCSSRSRSRCSSRPVEQRHACSKVNSNRRRA